MDSPVSRPCGGAQVAPPADGLVLNRSARSSHRSVQSSQSNELPAGCPETIRMSGKGANKELSGYRSVINHLGGHRPVVLASGSPAVFGNWKPSGYYSEIYYLGGHRRVVLASGSPDSRRRGDGTRPGAMDGVSPTLAPGQGCEQETTSA